MTVLLPNIKVKIMLYEPFLFNMVWKPTERFRNLSLEKYGLLKWKMCRNPVIHLKKKKSEFSLLFLPPFNTCEIRIQFLAI